MFEEKKIEEVYSQLNCNGSTGLDSQEIGERRRHYGKNKLDEPKKKTVLQKFVEQLCDSLIFVLLAAAVISVMLGEYSDAVIILIVVFVNAVVGVIQEGKAEKALEALKKMTSLKAVVKRDGKQMEVAAEELVPGDLVCLDAGRQVPADLRLVRSVNLKIEESALTGESVAVEKNALSLASPGMGPGDCRDMAYMSTNVTYGRGEGIVVSTGMGTEIGKIASMIHEAPYEATPLQKRLADLGKILSLLAIVLCVALFAVAVWQKRDVMDMLITAISLAVAAVPEGLPAVVTIVLALSVTRMVKVHTIVRRLPSVETLGAVSIVCSDKTGTLTQNRMTVTDCYTDFTMQDVKRMDVGRCRDFMWGFTLCNDGVVTGDSRVGDPTELALLDMAKIYGLQKSRLDREMPRLKELSFDSDRKMMTTLHKINGQNVSYTKGAADELLKRCTYVLKKGEVVPLNEGDKKKIGAAIGQMTGKALRVLALAMQRDVRQLSEKNLIFVGLAGMIDPARPEAAAAVKTFKKASVKTVMITGDHVDTAFAIARQLGIADRMDQCMAGEELQKLDEKELLNKIRDISVFARVSPDHKVRIVKAFKSLGNIVAMTGDGVNDAPSLKAADIGIAMGLTGTDVAKQAADVILTDDNFATIEKAIEEGRGIYENIKKSVLFLLSSNFGEIITMFAAIVMGLGAPLKANFILWINLITDSLPALALGVDNNDASHLMKNPPRKEKESLFAHGGLACTLFYGFLIAAISLIAFFKIPYMECVERGLNLSVFNLGMILKNPAILTRAQTYAFTVLGLSQLFHAIGMRDVTVSVFKAKPFSNKLMVGALLFGFLLQISVTEIPYLVGVFGTARLSLEEWAGLLGLAAMPLAAHELFVLETALSSRKSK